MPNNDKTSFYGVKCKSSALSAVIKAKASVHEVMTIYLEMFAHDASSCRHSWRPADTIIWAIDAPRVCLAVKRKDQKLWRLRASNIISAGTVAA